MILKRFKNNKTFTCAFLVACFTGMRTGEVCALTWDNIDLEKRIISIEHNVYSKVKDEKGKWFLGTTKTINGLRKVYICDTLLVALTNYKKKQELVRWRPSEFKSVENVGNEINEAEKTNREVRGI